MQFSPAKMRNKNKPNQSPETTSLTTDVCNPHRESTGAQLSTHRSLLTIKLFLLHVLMLTTITCCYGQIGETKAQLSGLYGAPSPFGKILSSAYDTVIDDQCTFKHQGMDIFACFKNGKAVLLMYQKTDKSPMSKKDVFSALSASIKKPDWILISGDNPNPRWRSGDSSSFAYYYPEPDYDGAPARFVRVQTATLDAIYCKVRRDNPSEAPKT